MSERKESAKARRDLRHLPPDDGVSSQATRKSRAPYVLEYLIEIPENFDLRRNSFDWFNATHRWYNRWHSWKRYRSLQAALQAVPNFLRRWHPIARITCGGEVLHRFGYEEAGDMAIKVLDTGRLLALDIDFETLYNQSVPGKGSDL